MKKSFALLMVLLPYWATAQFSELGLSAGIGMIAPPSGSIYFKADQSSSSPIASITYIVNLKKYTEKKINWQFGLDFSTIMTIKQESSKTYSYFGETIGNDGRYFRYANYMLSINPYLNIKYTLSPASYIYGGAGFGGVVTRNTSHKSPTDFADGDYTYTAPDGGKGIISEVHIGITQRLVQRLAVNAQVGFRYYHVSFNVDDYKYPGGNSFKYNTTVIPITVGLRYRMGWQKEYNSVKGKYQITKEDLKRD